MWFQTNKHIEYLKGRIKIAGKDIETIAHGFNTPLYVCNTSRVKDNYRRVQHTFESYALPGSQAIVYYAMKANNAKEILAELKKAGANIEVSSQKELEQILKLGFSPQRVLFTGIGFGLHNTSFIAQSGALINIDSFSQLELFKKYAPLDISIRFNPGIGIGYNHLLKMAGEDHGAGKLGIHKDKIIDAYITAKALGLNPIGLHLHIGSNWFGDKLPLFLEAVHAALDVVKKLKEKNIGIKRINFGGGLGVKHSEEQDEFPLEDYCKGIWELIAESNLNFESVCIEPGRYIVGDSTILLATVNAVEVKAGINYIVLDCGFNVFNHKFLYGIQPEIFNITKFNTRKKIKYCVAGYLGESGDIFAEEKNLPITEIGDIIAIFPAGAYCASELADYHLQQLPLQLFVNESSEPFDVFPYCKVCPKNCCYIGAVNVLPDEYDRIIKRTGKKEVFKQVGTYYMIDKKKGTPCPFLKKDGVTCSIQDIKPTDCKVWPIYFNNKGSIEQNTISHSCPANVFFSKDYIESLRKGLADIPVELRKEFYAETIKLGYTLAPIDKYSIND